MMPQFDPIYAPYIWAVYGLAFLLLSGMTVITYLRARKAQRDYQSVKKAKDVSS